MPKCYASNINDVSRQISNYLKLGWKKCLIFQSPVVLTKEEDCFHQPLFRVTISENLNCSIHYYGWLVSQSVSGQFDFRFNGVNQVLSDIENLNTCPGVSDTENDVLKVKNHIITSPGNSQPNPFPVVTILACR